MEDENASNIHTASVACFCWHPVVIPPESNPTHLSASPLKRKLRIKTVIFQVAWATDTCVETWRLVSMDGACSTGWKSFCLHCVKFPFYLCLGFFSPAAAIAESQGGHGRDRALYFEDLSECQWSQARGEILVTSYAQGLNPLSQASKTKSKSFFRSVHPSVPCITYAEFTVP